MKYEQYYFQTDQIWLRLWEPQDASYEYEDFMDSPAMSMLYDEILLPGKERRSRLNGEFEQAEESEHTYTILNHKEEYVGQVRYNYINEHHGTFSIGVMITKKHRGCGYGTAAMGLLIKYGFEERRLHKFEGSCLDENTASAKMMERLECTLEGRIRESVFMNGRYHDRLLYGMTKQEYERNRRRK